MFGAVNMKPSKNVLEEQTCSQIQISSQPSSEKNLEKSAEATIDNSKENNAPIYLKRI